MSFWASFAKTDAEKLTYDAGNTAKIGSYSRRELDWAFQSNLVAGEITQTFKQLRGAQIREAIAEKEWKNHQQQMKHAEEIEQFLNAEGTEKKGKVSNKALYTWMKREVRGLYGQVFQFAFDVAKKAERALQHELGNTDLSYLQFGYMGGKEGLLAGEKMYFDLKRMEMAYYELNQREYELTKHVSLLQVSPMALIELRTTGKCVVRLPEELFDMDCPGHYFRRIKSVAVSIPCVTGPYTSVNCTLTLLKSSIRKSTLAGDDYARQGADDDRFSDHFGSMQSIVTSTAQNDGGLFETNLRDERYLPFEYSGVISEWQLELPKDLKQFDYDTISDVILHMRYTAREAGVPLRNGAVRNLNTQIDDALAAGNIRLFSVRHEFPTEWAKFQAVKIEGEVKTAELTLPLREEHYPFWSRGKVTATKRLEFIARYQKEASNLGVFKDKEKTDEQGKLPKDPTEKRIARGVVKEALIPTPTSSFTCFLDQNKMDDLFIALTWGK
jgi:cell division protein FtsB